jgi:carbon-monoxide dehydrogenase medium subunit/6-hydroxypseudooxynicotine dehydrogenase subunit alpha
VKAPPFAYARAETSDEALELLTSAGDDAKLLAGGQSLVPLLAYRLARPSHVIDIDSLAEYDSIECGEQTTIGALVRHAILERSDLPGAHQLLSLAAANVGHLPIRTRGTLGGSLAHADPAAELPLAVLTLEGELVARSTAGTREIAAADFFVGPFTTALDPAELLVEIRLPPTPAGARTAFTELSLRSGDFALAAVAAAVACDASRRVTWARIGIGAVQATPMRAHAAEDAIVGGALDAGTIALAAREAAGACEPADDNAADSATRRRLVAALVRDALEQIREQAA